MHLNVDVCVKNAHLSSMQCKMNATNSQLAVVLHGPVQGVHPNNTHDKARLCTGGQWEDLTALLFCNGSALSIRHAAIWQSRGCECCGGR
eukprot:3876252-Amphidinium_carterae.1